MAPALLPQTREPRGADKFLVRATVPIREVRKLERDLHAFDDEGGAQSGTESKEEHPPAAGIVAERLHRRVVQHAQRPAERLGKVEAHPPGRQIVRLSNWSPANDWSWISDRDHVVMPVGGRLADCGHHSLR